jgi:Coenzyme PQQ synthesis protein D (PqqD)
MKYFNYYKVNAPHVIHEIIDGEAVLVNMKNGYYYSLDDAGADIWDLIEKGNSLSQIEDLLKRKYRSSDSEIKSGLYELISNLHTEALIVGLDALPNASALDGKPTDGSTAKKDFVKPTLQKYTDMEDLLLLDPIHDVDDETGWPNKPSTDNT